ncbi:MAG: MBL fold metallo-hydrolase [Candidatus Izemoplasmatales bacterium]
MKITKFHANVYTQNSYLVEEQDHCFVIDPGMNGEEILTYIEENHLTMEAVLLTHAHFDHTKGLRNLAKKGAFTLYLHQEEQKYLNDPLFHYAKMFNDSFMAPQKAIISTFKDLDQLLITGINVTVHHTPGHTIGSSCFEIGVYLFTGDTLFVNGYGRTDLLTGSIKDMRKSLDYLYHHFSSQTMIHPGHDESKKLKDVQKLNP